MLVRQDRLEDVPVTWGPRRNHGTSERGSVGLAQTFHDAGTVPFRRRFAEMDGTQLGNELAPQLRAADGKQLGSHPQPLRGRAVVQAPLAQLGEDGHQLNRRLGQAIRRPPSRPRVLTGQQAGAD
jgi:hypothetical protein